MSVIDNGIGMDQDAMQRIFQPFVQAESATTRRFGGTGLGLSICKRLTAMMGGWIEVQSVEGEGSTFSVTLPFRAAKAPVRVLEDIRTSDVQAGPRFAMAGAPLVLVAEDNPINQKVIGHQLALLGVSVEMVADGLEALATWRAGRSTQRHALLLTDLHMPGMDGYTLAATVRIEETGGSRIPIVALSANALKGEIDRCRAAGMDDYLSKPAQIDKLGDMLKQWLPNEEAQTPMLFDPVDCEEVDVLEVELGLCAYDDRALERLVGDDPALLADFRQSFVVSALSTMDEMRRAANRTDLTALSDLAHRLKSSARAIGAVSLATCCERMERVDQTFSTADMHCLMTHMEDALAYLMTRLSGQQSVPQHCGVAH